MATYQPNGEKRQQTMVSRTLWGLAQIALLLVTFSPAQAQTVIDFENLATPVKVFGQYSGAGISFNGPTAMKHKPRITRSGLTGIEPCFAAEFCTAPLAMKIAPGKSGVTLWVGSSIPRPQLTVVVMRAFDLAGQLVGETTAELGPSTDRIFTSRQLRIERAERDIRRVTLGYAPGPDGPLVNNGLLVDDIVLIPRHGARLRLEMMEIVQATQMFDNSVPLVAGKATVVRAFIANPGQSGTVANITGKLVARRSGGATMGPISFTGPVDFSSAWPQARLRENGALNFRIPEEWTAAGFIHFELSEVSVEGGAAQPCVDCARAANFRPTRRLNLVLAPYVYNQEVPAQTPDILLTPMGSLQWLNNVYPLRGEFPADESGIRILKYLPIASTDFESHAEDGQFLSQLESQQALLQIQNFSWPSFKLAALLSCANCGGAARLDGPAFYSYMGPTPTDDFDPSRFAKYGLVLAHEMGHSFGRSHAGNAHGESSGGGADYAYPYPHGGIGDPGVATITHWWDPSRMFMEPGHFADGHEHDIMSYGHGLDIDTGPWISPYTYKALFAKLAISNAAALALPQSAREVLVVIGHLKANGDASLRPLWRLTTPLVSSDGLNGDFRIELRDKGGDALATHYFDATKAGDGDTLHFSEFVPWVEGTREIRLSGPDGELMRRAVSAHTPWVRLAEPRYGKGKSQLHVSWTAGDADRDALTFAVLYSEGEGKPWLPVAEGLTQSKTDIDTRLLPGSRTARLRVLVTDGANTAVAESARPFVTDDKPPLVGILSASTGAKMQMTGALELSGAGYDPEEGMLSQSQLQWASDRDGSLGSGARLTIKKLSQGRHKITLKGCDIAGLCSSDTADVEMATPASVD